MQETIIVLGMHRSGTSLVAELLHGCGVYAGDPKLLLGANDGNERGYWEHGPLVAFNDNLLSFVDSSWSVPPTREDEQRLADRALNPTSHEQAVRLIRSMESSGPAWFWKDPRLALTFPFWQKLWRDPLYVVCIRDPLEIAQSLQRRNHFPISASLLLWQIYMTAILREVRDKPGVLFVDYARLVKAPRQQCERLFLFLQEYLGVDGPKMDLTSIVTPKLKHHDSRQSFDEAAIVSAEQARLYSFLQRLVEDGSAHFEDQDFSLYPGYREYLQTVDLLRLWLEYWYRLQASTPGLKEPPCPPSIARVLGLA